MKELFAPVRQEILEKGYTEEEINQWIDEAVQAVRSERASYQIISCTNVDGENAVSVGSQER